MCTVFNNFNQIWFKTIKKLQKFNKEVFSIELIITIVIAFVLIIIVGAISFRMGISYRKKIAEAEIGGAEQEAKKIVS